MSLCEIKLRKILNVSEFDEIHVDEVKNYDYWKYRICFKNIIFFYKNPNKIVLGYKIKIYNGSYINFPVIGCRNIKLKQKLKKEIIIYKKKIDKRKQFTKYLILIKYSNLPIEMIDKILFYYN